MTQPPDLIERLAKAMYDDDRAQFSSVDTAPFWEWKNACPDSRKYWLNKASAALTEAVAWLTEGVKSREGDEGNPDAAVMRAIKRMEQP